MVTRRKELSTQHSGTPSRWLRAAALAVDQGLAELCRSRWQYVQVPILQPLECQPRRRLR